MRPGRRASVDAVRLAFPCAAAALLGACVSAPPQKRPAAHARPHPSAESAAVYVLPERIAAVKARFERNDPATVRQVGALLETAKKALALDLPESYPFIQESADAYGSAGVDLAVAYRLTGDVAFRDQALRVLLGMARGFRSNEEFLRRNHSLDSSVAIPPYVFAFELLQRELAPVDRANVAAVLASAADVIKRNAYGGPHDEVVFGAERKHHDLSNIRSYQNAAVFAVGAALSRHDLQDWAIDDRKGGFKAHIQGGYDGDGLIVEGSAAYELYDLAALVLTAQAASTLGNDLFSYKSSNGNSLRRALDALIGFSRPDLVLPSTGDGAPSSLREFADLYRIAYDHYQEPAYGYIVESAIRAPYRSWTVLTRALAVFADPTVKTKRPKPGPMEYRAGFGMLRQDATPIFFGERSSSRWALLSAQDHTWAHQNANQLDLQLGLGRFVLSAHASRGFLEYSDADRNANYVRARGYNIITLDGNPPLGSASFDSNGAAAHLSYCEIRTGKKTAVRVCGADMTGGYERAGQETSSRVVLLAGARDGQTGYVVDWSRLAMANDGREHRVGWIWHGPVDAVEKKTNLEFSPASPDPRDPTFRYVDQLRAAPASSTEFSVDWSTGPAGLSTWIMGSERPTAWRMGKGPEGAPFLYAERTFDKNESVDAEFAAVHELYMRKPALMASALRADAGGRGIVVSGRGFRDWTVLANGSEAVKVVNPRSANEFLIMKGRYGHLRVIGSTIDILGDKVREISVKASGIRKVYYNGKEARFSVQKGIVRVRL